MATSALSKEEVQVLWTAPEMGSGCINLKAMVVERNDFWFMDDGGFVFILFYFKLTYIVHNLHVLFLQHSLTLYVKTTVQWLLHLLLNLARLAMKQSMRLSLRAFGPGILIQRTSPSMNGRLSFLT